MSWWKRGEEEGEQAWRVGPVGVDVAGPGDRDDDLACAPASVSSVPKLPISGVGDGPVGGQLRPVDRSAVPPRAVGDQVLAGAAGDHLVAGVAVDVGDGRAGEELQVVDGPREAGLELAGGRRPRPRSGPDRSGSRSTWRSSARNRPIAAVRKAGSSARGAAGGAERRVAERRDDGAVGGRRGGREVARERVRLARRVAVAGGAVGVDDVGGPGGGRGADLAAAAAVGGSRPGRSPAGR